jgi:Mrp family chromosome partitioning ATPase/uncharacterized protein involved in exopolysaccharide biosynthesis
MRLFSLRRRIVQTQTYSDHHRNWLLTIAQIKMPIVLLGAGAIALIVTLLTFLFDPVYEAKTLITLDANLNKTLKSVEISYPYTTSTDYIRYEFFATHSVTLMHAPQLADQFVKRWNIKDGSGKIMFPEYFIKPNLFRLLFSNNGQGIRAQWVSDTQQFIIVGYSKDPDTAVAYSRDYTESFLKEDANNAISALDIIVERLDNQILEISGQREAVNVQIQQVKKRYRIADVDVENEALISKIYSIKSDLNSARLDEDAYKLRIDHLYREAANHEALNKYQIIMESNPTILTLKTKIQELTRSLVGLSVEQTKENPAYKVMEKTLEATKESLKEEAKKTLYQEIDQRSNLLDTVLSSMLTYDLSHIIYLCKIEHYNSLLKLSESRLEDLITAQSELNKLTDQRTQLSTLLSTALTNHSNVSNIMKKPVPFFRVVSLASIDKAKLKYYKYFPKRKIILPLTFMASLFALSFLVIAKELYANTLYCGWQLSTLKHCVDYADVPMLGISATNPKSDFDAVICKHIHELCLLTNDAQIIRVTSGAKGEGKATIARAMALYHHKMGKSVALVDGDLIHHSSSSWFGLNDRPGLMDYICGQKEPADIIIHDQIPNISFIPAGSQDNLNLKPFVLKPLSDLFSILTSDYEKIIFVDEPLGGSHFMLADMLPPHDIIIVLKSGEHSIYEVDRWTGMREFTKGKATLKGIVINKIII